MKKTTLIVISIVLVLCSAFAAGSKEFAPEKKINLVSREDGSGTRGAFIELFGIEQKNAQGKKEDLTSAYAQITNSTQVMMQSVAQDLTAIGYVSLGSLNGSVKALKIDEIQPSVENIAKKDYQIARPFNIVTTAEVSKASQAFIVYILSDAGQKVIEDNGYIKAVEGLADEGIKESGKVVVAGSSSVTPVMEKLKEAYEKINPNITIEIQQSDSTTGVNSAVSGICDIGMASRELKASEVEKGALATVIAMDGIAVIVNNGNPLESLSKKQVMELYTGKLTTWAQVMD